MGTWTNSVYTNNYDDSFESDKQTTAPRIFCIGQNQPNEFINFHN